MSVTTLTKRLVATAQPKDSAYELRDTQVRGLLLRVQPSGHKAWVVTWEHGKRRTLGSAGHLTLDEAREIARKIIAEYIQTGLPSIAKPAAPKITLAEFLRDHYRPWARTELKGADKYILRLERVFPAALEMPMSDINAAWVERWWMERLQSKARPDRGLHHQGNRLARPRELPGRGRQGSEVGRPGAEPHPAVAHEGSQAPERGAVPQPSRGAAVARNPYGARPRTRCRAQVSQ